MLVDSDLRRRKGEGRPHLWMFRRLGRIHIEQVTQPSKGKIKVAI